jgi:hypothetical protein
MATSVPAGSALRALVVSGVPGGCIRARRPRTPPRRCENALLEVGI